MDDGRLNGCVRPYRSVVVASKTLGPALLGCVRPPRRALGFVPGGDVRRGWRRAESRGGVALPSACGGDLGRQGFCAIFATRTPEIVEAPLFETFLWQRGVVFPKEEVENAMLKLYIYAYDIRR